MSKPFAWLCSSTVALSALLIFLLEPMFAKMALPLLGGAANVWIAAMMFYQIALLIGYLYAHLLSRAPLRAQWLVHGLLCALALAALPVAIPQGWAPPADSNPAPALFAMMSLAIGAPFVLLSATASLVQNWFALAQPGENPYRLYAFSNAGSFLGLIAYPLGVEPGLALSAQAHWWSFGYVAVALLLFAVGFVAQQAPQAEKTAEAPLEKIPAARVAGWIMLAAAPSSLLLSFTNFLTVDVGSLPLLWVIPLAIYLATFILAFSSRGEFFAEASRRYYPILAISGVVALIPVFALTAPTAIAMMAVYLAIYGFAALGCHAELARRKPEPRQLTFFFLAVSFGGALGGVFNTLVAPLIFKDIVEFPLGLILAAWLISGDSKAPAKAWIFAGVAAAVAALAILWPQDASEGAESSLVFRLALVGVLLPLFAIRAQRAPLAAGLLACLGLALFLPTSARLVYAERNFYGVNRVRDLDAARLRRMEHGDTIHGLAALDAGERLVTLGYYNPAGGLAETTLAIHAGKQAPRIALVGLGAGEMVCIGEKGWTYDLYEIDPGVIRIAGDPALFPFLSDCPAGHKVIQGDGRLKLREAAPASYDQIILDAFTSDSIPTHLLTREALAEYMQKLKPGGVLTLHLSNRYFSLAPVVAAEARELDLAGAVHLSAPKTIGPNKLPVMGTLVVNLSRDAQALAPLREKGWSRLRPVAGIESWSDDWSNVLSALILPGHELQTGEDVAGLRGSLVE